MNRRGPNFWLIRFVIMLVGFGAGFWLVSQRPKATIETIAGFTGVDQLSNRKATLTLAGTSVPVDVKTSEQDGEVTLSLIAESKVVDREVYRVNPGGVKLTFISGDTFAPDLPLLLYPVEIGAVESWKGTVESSGVTEPADAEIVNAREDLNVAGGPFDSVKVTVSLRVTPESGTPRSRELIFWIVDKQGIVKREISGISTRDPR